MLKPNFHFSLCSSSCVCVLKHSLKYLISVDIFCDTILVFFNFEDALPEGFSQQFEEQQQKPRPKFCSAVSQRGTPPHLEENKKKENGRETKVI